MLNIPNNFQVLFTQGGSDMQVTAVCQNLASTFRKANVVVNGHYSQQFAEAAAQHCEVHTINNFAEPNATKLNTFKVDPKADFLFYVDNETRNGFEFNDFPFDQVPANMPVVADMSSSLLTKSVDWSKYGAVFGSAGVANTCIVIVRNDLIGKHLPTTPTLLTWAAYANGAFPNTPNIWGIYICGVYLSWQMA